MMDWQAFFLSLKLALSTSGLLLIMGLPLAFYLSSRTSKWADVLISALSFPLLLPPTVLGFYLLLVLGPLHLAFSFQGLLLASLFYHLPYVLQPFINAFRSVPHSLMETAWALGDSPWRTFYRVILPLSKNGIFSGLLMTFAHCLGEFGVALMVGGNIPGESRTLSIALYDQVQSLDYPSANRTALLLLFICGFSLVVLSLFGKDRSRKVHLSEENF